MKTEPAKIKRDPGVGGGQLACAGDLCPTGGLALLYDGGR